MRQTERNKERDRQTDRQTDRDRETKRERAYGTNLANNRCTVSHGRPTHIPPYEARH